MNTSISAFFLYYLKKKLDEYIYTYFYIIPIIPLNNFFYNKDCCYVIKKKQKTFIFLLLIKTKISLKKIPFIIFKCYRIKTCPFFENNRLLL